MYELTVLLLLYVSWVVVVAKFVWIQNKYYNKKKNSKLALCYKLIGTFFSGSTWESWV